MKGSVCRPQKEESGSTTSRERTDRNRACSALAARSCSLAACFHPLEISGDASPSVFCARGGFVVGPSSDGYWIIRVRERKRSDDHPGFGRAWVVKAVADPRAKRVGLTTQVRHPQWERLRPNGASASPHSERRRPPARGCLSAFRVGATGGRMERAGSGHGATLCEGSCIAQRGPCPLCQNDKWGLVLCAISVRGWCDLRKDQVRRALADRPICGNG